VVGREGGLVTRCDDAGNVGFFVLVVSNYLIVPFLIHQSQSTTQLAVNVAGSILIGPVLWPPDKSRNVAICTFEMLQMYSVRSAKHTTLHCETGLFSTSP
jgi:hypothetical protein